MLQGSQNEHFNLDPELPTVKRELMIYPVDYRVMIKKTVLHNSQHLVTRDINTRITHDVVRFMIKSIL